MVDYNDNDYFYEQSVDAIKKNWTAEKQRELKRQEVDNIARPLCQAFSLDSFEYVLDEQHEYIEVEGQKIAVKGYLPSRIGEEIINYVWVKIVAPHKELFTREQTLALLRKNWMASSRKRCSHDTTEHI